jgi:hypothetical protein
MGLFQIEDDNLGALRRHHAGGCKAQAVKAGTAGNNGHFVLEQHTCLLLHCEIGELSGAIVGFAQDERKRYKLKNGLDLFMLHCNDFIVFNA